MSEHAVSRVFRRYIGILEQIDEEYLSQRADDLRDLERRVIANLAGSKGRGIDLANTKVILISRFLSPSETATLSKDRVLGIATDIGGLTSHASILARALEIPAVVGLKTVSSHVSSGDIVIIDGTRGRVIISPDDQTVEQYRLLQRDFAFTRYLAEKDKSKPAITIDQYHSTVLANVDRAADVKEAFANGAEGVGLFRTEYLYLERDRQPKEDEQYEEYLKALEAADGKMLTFRTFDLGFDKLPESMRAKAEKEGNPALGLRAIRLARMQVPMFRHQLRAILRAAGKWAKSSGLLSTPNVRIMFPMIAHPHEFVWAKLQVKSVRDELAEQGVFVPRDVQIGAMLEIPSIMLSADYLLPRSDFFSIGTNDLIQYLFAVDRTNEDVSYLYNPGHRAIFSIIKMFTDAADKLEQQKRPHISVCGEMASDPIILLALLGMGIRHLSVSIPSIPLVKHIVRSVSQVECRQIASKSYAQLKPELDLTELRDYLNKQVDGSFA